MNVALILAGGVGSRMGAPVPKQFIRILGKPIIAYTLEILEKNASLDAVAVACVQGYREELQSIITEYGLHKVKWIIEGGETFTLSVYNGAKFLSGVLSPEDFVLIHMSVSPFIGDDILDDGLRVAHEKGNSISVNPCLLCMGSYDTEEYSTKSVLRETLIGLNTPQTYRLGELLELYERAEREGILEELEPHTTSLFYHYNRKLYFSKGYQLNIKITTQEDLDLFEAFCLMKRKREGAIC